MKKANYNASSSLIDEYVKEKLIVIGENLKRIRGGMAKTELARKSGVSRNTIISAEKGIPISLDNLLKIVKALDVRPEDVFLSSWDKENISHRFELFLEKFMQTFDVELKS